MANNESRPKIHHLLEFPDLKLLHLLSVLDDIKARDGQLERTVILVRKDYFANELSHTLRDHGFIAVPLTRLRKERRRRAVSERFNSGRYPVLIVSATGLNAETGDIHHFVNYDMELPYPLNRRGMLNVRSRRHG